MKATLTVNGNSIDIELNTEQYEKLFPEEKKKTGYERLDIDKKYLYIGSDYEIVPDKECNLSDDDEYYNIANYYSDETVAENMARAKKLWNQVHRRAVELCKPIKPNHSVYSVIYWSEFDSAVMSAISVIPRFGDIRFDTQEHCQQVIDEFYDELKWYFTEFRDRADM